MFGGKKQEYTETETFNQDSNKELFLYFSPLENLLFWR